jgi:uncharacterized lipoprotein YddW (UPF0748 family)
MSDRKIVLSSPVTHSDWVWRDEARIGHHEASVKYILDRCREFGWRKLYWRCLDGGQALYASKLMDSVAVGYDPDNYHAWQSPGQDELFGCLERYGDFDSLRAAVDYGHEIGLEIHAWLSINEDDHAWGLISRFSKAHPEFRWVKRSGLPYNSQLSFAFEEVREYKLGIVAEVLEYDIDGVFFDWMRTGDVRNEPQALPDGTADFGHEKPLVEAFREQFGVDYRDVASDDERWLQLRCEPQTDFMRRASALIRAKREDLRIAVMGHHAWSHRGATPWINGNRQGLLLDTPTWAREGLMDEIVAAGYFIGEGTPEKAYACMQDEVGDRCAIWLWWWTPPTAEDFRESVRVAEALGAPQILYWESDYLDLPGREAEAGRLAEAMRGYVGQ